MKPYNWKELFRLQIKSKGETRLLHDTAVSSARSFLHTLTSYKRKVIVRVKSGLIMLRITLMIFRSKLDLKSQVEQRDFTDLSGAGQHQQWHWVTANLLARLLLIQQICAGRGLVSSSTPAAPSDWT